MALEIMCKTNMYPFSSIYKTSSHVVKWHSQCICTIHAFYKHTLNKNYENNLKNRESWTETMVICFQEDKLKDSSEQLNKLYTKCHNYFTHHSPLPASLDKSCIVCLLTPQGPYKGPHTDPSYHVNRDPGILKGLDNTTVGKTPEKARKMDF